MRRQGLGFGRLGSIAVLGAVVAGAFAACSSSNGGAPGADGGTDSGSAPGLDSSSPAPDASGQVDAGPSSDGGLSDADSDAAPPDAALGPFNVLTTIAVEGEPSAIAFNAANNVLYVALAKAGASQTGVGIALIDGTTNTVASTFASPGDAAAPSAIAALAVDIVSNTLYAVDSNPGGQTLYVLDGLAGTVTAAIPVGSAKAIQVDSTHHVAYVLGAGAPVTLDGGGSITPAMVTVVGGADDAGGPVTLTDLALTAATTLAFDAVSAKLYVCGMNGTEAAVDVLDAAHGLAATGAQQTFGAATEVACVAGWGSAAIVTKSPGAVSFLDAATVTLPATFVPALAAGSGSAASASVVAFGAGAASDLEVVSATASDGGGSLVYPPTAALSGVGALAWQSVAVASPAGGVIRAYLTYEANDDAGVLATAESVVYASIQTQ